MRRGFATRSSAVCFSMKAMLSAQWRCTTRLTAFTERALDQSVLAQPPGGRSIACRADKTSGSCRRFASRTAEARHRDVWSKLSTGRRAHNARRADAQRRRVDWRFRHLPPRGSAIHRQANRAGAELRRPGRHRHREHAAAQRIARSRWSSRPRRPTCCASSAHRPAICSRCSPQCWRTPRASARRNSAQCCLPKAINSARPQCTARRRHGPRWRTREELFSPGPQQHPLAPCARTRHSMSRTCGSTEATSSGTRRRSVGGNRRRADARGRSHAQGREVVGVIGIYREEVRPFTEKQIALVRTSPRRPSSPSRTRGCSTNCGNRCSSRRPRPTCSRSSAARLSICRACSTRWWNLRPGCAKRTRPQSIARTMTAIDPSPCMALHLNCATTWQNTRLFRLAAAPLSAAPCMSGKRCKSPT